MEVFRAYGHSEIRGSKLGVVENYIRRDTEDWDRPKDFSPKTEWRLCSPEDLAHVAIERGEFLLDSLEVSHRPVPRGV